MLSIAAPARPGARAGPAAGAVGGYIKKQGPGPIAAVLSWILVGLVPTIIYGFFQMDWVFKLIENTGEVLVPGRGGLLRWSVFALFFLFNTTVAIGIGGGKKSQFPDPRTGKPLMIFPELPTVLLKVALYYIVAIILPIFFGKPLIANWVIQPLLTGLVSVKQGELAFAIAEGAQKAGMDVTLPTGEAGKPKEERLCSGYTKFDEEGTVIKGGMQVDVVIGESDTGPPPWNSEGGFYRVPITIKNLGKEPLKVIVLKGDSAGLTLKTSEKGIFFYTGKPQVGTYISGKETPKKEKTIDAYYMLTPLGCLEGSAESSGCLIEPDLEKTVELISSSKVAFKENTAASLNVELKISYEKGKKGVGTGHMLIFPTSTDAAARQKASNFKSSYCPTTLAGPLDVVISPPFYTVGGSDKGGDGYFAVDKESQCPTKDEEGKEIKEFRYLPGIEGKNYCLQNIKTVKVRLINTDENAQISMTSVKICPFKEGSNECDPAGGKFPKEYTRLREAGTKGNCFLESLGEGEGGIVFIDESGLKSSSTDKSLFEKVKGPFRKELTLLCRYQIGDSPGSPFTITEFKDFQFRAEVEYEYIPKFTKGGIPMLENK